MGRERLLRWVIAALLVQNLILLCLFSAAPGSILYVEGLRASLELTALRWLAAGLLAGCLAGQLWLACKRKK